MFNHIHGFFPVFFMCLRKIGKVPNHIKIHTEKSCVWQMVCPRTLELEHFFTPCCQWTYLLQVNYFWWWSFINHSIGKKSLILGRKFGTKKDAVVFYREQWDQEMKSFFLYVTRRNFLCNSGMKKSQDHLFLFSPLMLRYCESYILRMQGSQQVWLRPRTCKVRTEKC